MQTSLQTAKFTLKPRPRQRRKMLFPCKAHNSEFVCRQKLVVSTHKLQKNVPENADKPANCKITLKPRPMQRRKMLFLCKAHNSEFSCRQKNSHALIAEKTCLTAKQVRCRRLFDRLAVAIANQTKTRLQTACTFCCTTQVCLDICAVDF